MEPLILILIIVLLLFGGGGFYVGRPGYRGAGAGIGNILYVIAAIALIVLWLHRENIARLRAGTEPRVGSRQ